MSQTSGLRQSRKARSKKDSFWPVVNQKVLPLGLIVLTAVLIASVPLITSTQREASEYRIASLHRDTMYLQEEKAQLLKQVSDRLTVKGLEELGAKAGLRPPAQIVYIVPVSAP